MILEYQNISKGSLGPGFVRIIGNITKSKIKILQIYFINELNKHGIKIWQAYAALLPIKTFLKP